VREEFRDIISGWILYSGIEDLSDRIERAAKWTKANGPLLPDEQATIELMIRAQIARGMPDLIRRAGLSQEYGLPPDDFEETDDDDA
jgi:hypothetical protein